jgi:hypothetical protein
MVIVAGFAFIGIVLFHDPVLVKQRPKIVFLDMDSLKEASDSIISPDKGPAVDKIFPADHKNKPNDTILWADAYLCTSIGKYHSPCSDTLILLLDAKTDDKLYKIKYPEDYWTGLKKAPRLRKCKIMVSPEQLARIKRARYKFVSVDLITDDY